MRFSCPTLVCQGRKASPDAVCGFVPTWAKPFVHSNLQNWTTLHADNLSRTLLSFARGRSVTQKWVCQWIKFPAFLPPHLLLAISENSGSCWKRTYHQDQAFCEKGVWQISECCMIARNMRLNRKKRNVRKQSVCFRPRKTYLHWYVFIELHIVHFAAGTCVQFWIWEFSWLTCMRLSFARAYNCNA